MLLRKPFQNSLHEGITISTKRPRIAVRGVFYRDNRILLSHHNNAGREWYLIPGGGVHHGESLEQAFHRELMEETGYRCTFGDVIMIREVMNLANDIPILPDQFHQIEIYVTGEITGDSGEPVAMDQEQAGYCWMAVSELANITFFPGELAEYFIRREWSVIYRGISL